MRAGHKICGTIRIVGYSLMKSYYHLHEFISTLMAQQYIETEIWVCLHAILIFRLVGFFKQRRHFCTSEIV